MVATLENPTYEKPLFNGKRAPAPDRRYPEVIPVAKAPLSELRAVSVFDTGQESPSALDAFPWDLAGMADQRRTLALASAGGPGRGKQPFHIT